MTDDERSARYHRLQLALAAAGLLLRVAYLLVVLATGVARDLADAAARLLPAWWWQVGVVTVVLGAVHALVLFPLAWTRGYELPRRHGLLHQSPISWLGDRLKGAALGGILALAGIEIIYGLLRVSRWWWLVASGVFFAGSVLMTLV